MSGHDRTHSRFSPSQSERFLICPGSVTLIERVAAREGSEHAILGTKAHDVLEKALLHRERSALVAQREHSIYCLETFDDAFITSVQAALDYIYDILDEHPDAILYNEVKVNPPNEVEPGEASGYCDVAIHIPSIRTLHVIDYKHGVGVAKSAKTTQIKQYALGFMYDEFALIDPASVDTVHLTIIQPRAFHEDGTIRTITCNPYDVYEYLEELENGIKACLKPDAPLVAGDHCHSTFCAARTVCPAREALAVKAVSNQFKNIRDISTITLPAPEGLDVERLSYIKQAGDLLSTWLADVDAHIKELLAQGVHVPGFKIVETEARREWQGDDNELAAKLAALADRPSVDFMRMKLVTITDAERMVTSAFKKRVGKDRAKQAAEDAKRAMALLTIRQSSGNTKVVPEDHPAPAMNRAGIFKATNVAGLLPPPPKQMTEDRR